jgi:coenzyme Q-binding protein COQ10
MIRHKEVYFSEFSNVQLYSLVADIEGYPQFLPWCAAARILSQKDKMITAELLIKFASFYERYTSEVKLVTPKESDGKYEIIVNLVDGPFNQLSNYWSFQSDQNTGKTEVHFEIEFEFKSPLLQKMIGTMFEGSLKKMMRSFEDRARAIYA